MRASSAPTSVSRPRCTDGALEAAPSDPAEAQEEVLRRFVDRPGTVLLCGAVDTGKTFIARRLLGAVLHAGRAAVWIDTDLGQSTVGPPATLGLRHLRTAADLEHDGPGPHDELYFVGALSPRGHLLEELAGTTLLTVSARRASTVIVVDTGGFIPGLAGQQALLHRLEVVRPQLVIGLQRDGELDGLLAVARGLGDAEVVSLPVHPDVRRKTPGQRTRWRREQLGGYFRAGCTSVGLRDRPYAAFLPTLPPDTDLTLLDRLLVGVTDWSGRHVGVGVLDYSLDGLHVTVPTAAVDAVTRRGALRLGSVRVDEAWRARDVDLRQVLGRVRTGRRS